MKAPNQLIWIFTMVAGFVYLWFRIAKKMKDSQEEAQAKSKRHQRPEPTSLERLLRDHQHLKSSDSELFDDLESCVGGGLGFEARALAIEELDARYNKAKEKIFLSKSLDDDPELKNKILQTLERDYKTLLGQFVDDETEDPLKSFS